MSRKKLGISVTFPGLPQRLRILREKSDLSQEKLGELIGLSKATVCRYEAGKQMPSEESLQRYATHFKKTREWLLRGETPATGGLRAETTSVELLRPEKPTHNVADKAPELNGKLMVDIIALLEECLRERGSPAVNARDKGWLIVDLYNRYSKTARLAVNKATVNSYLDRIV